MIEPRALGPGARVALVAPAGPLATGAVERAEERVRALGWEPVPGEFIRERFGYLSAPDSCRAADLDSAIASQDIDGIWCLRGGYGTMRILEQVDPEPLRFRPRPLIGFSDNTALHLLVRRSGLISFHGPHPAATDTTDFSLDCLRRMVTVPEPAGILPFPPHGSPAPETIVPGAASGILVGGNLSLIAATTGTSVQLDARGTILFLEEVGEPLYRIDRLLTQLRMAGVLAGVAGVAIGAISGGPDSGEDGRIAGIEALLADRLGDLGVPLASGFPFGHIADNWTLPLGARARLDASAGTLEILDRAVAP